MAKMVEVNDMTNKRYTQGALAEVRPGPYSQSVSSTMGFEGQAGKDIVDIDSASLSAASFTIQPVTEPTWDQVMEDTLDRYAEAWERLSER
jgi:hypothetical protein